MAITRDAVATATQTDGTLNLTINLTIGAGSNIVLYVGVGVDDATDKRPQSATWNGTEAMTLIGSVAGSSVNQNSALYRLVNPTTGAHSVVVVPSASAVATDYLVGVAVSYFGVDQSTPDDTPVTDGGSDTTVSATVTSAAGDVVIDSACVNSNPTITIGGGHTELANLNVGGAGGTMGVFGESTGGGTETMSWSWTGAQRTSQVAVNINAAGGGGTPLVNLLATLGAGRAN